MGRTIKLLFGIIFCFFIIVSLSFSFEVISHNLEYFLYKKEKLLWSFKIKEFIQKDEFSFEGKEVYVTSKNKGLKIKAKRAFYNKKEDKFIFKNNVYLITPKHEEIETQELIFFPKKDLIITDKDVMVKKEDLIIKGKGLIYNTETENFQVKEKAKVQLKL